MALDTNQIYELILNPRAKFTKKSADPKRFARIIQKELEDITTQLTDPTTEYVIIDGKKVFRHRRLDKPSLRSATADRHGCARPD